MNKYPMTIKDLALEHNKDDTRNVIAHQVSNHPCLDVPIIFGEDLQKVIALEMIDNIKQDPSITVIEEEWEK